MQAKIITAFIIMLLSATSSNSDERYNPGKTWASWSDYTRNIYLTGFNDGASRAFMGAAWEWLDHEDLRNVPRPEHVTKVANKTLIKDRPVIRDITTNLYTDPANTYISFGDMFFIAQDKLDGKDVNQELLKARKVAKKLHEVLRQLKHE